MNEAKGTTPHLAHRALPVRPKPAVAVRELFFWRRRDSVAAVREFVRRVAREWGLGERVEDVVLCASELATNAVLHGVPAGRGYVVRVERLGATAGLRIEFHDSGDGRDSVPVSGWARPAGGDPGAESGRGLIIVNALADRWGAAVRRPGKIVWCEFSEGAPLR
ncbi:ATP-binding protein [Streptomyces sp. NBC_01335]|uniref:ATP-binding protein n=1 Tax=Streptomyces sp. NBC_01335 TaxID=2903828 RepID=UPI002E0D9223